MKKKLLLSIVICVTLASCVKYVLPPLNPQIIGSGLVKYNTKDSLWVVVLDTISYPIAHVTTLKQDKSTLVIQQTPPRANILVTIFTTHDLGIQAVEGKQSIAQIEEIYHRETSGFSIIALILILMVIFIILKSQEKKHPHSL